MTSVGLVVELKGDMAKVRFVRESACGGNCSSCQGCSVKPLEKWIDNTLDACVGDKVLVKSSSKRILFSAFVMYIFPLIMFFSMYILVNSFFKESISIISGVFAFLISFAIAKRYGNNVKIECEMERLA